MAGGRRAASPSPRRRAAVPSPAHPPPPHPPLTILEHGGHGCAPASAEWALPATAEEAAVVIRRAPPFAASASWLRAFLPDGFPASVTADYVPFQIWDTTQAICRLANAATPPPSPPLFFLRSSSPRLAPPLSPLPLSLSLSLSTSLLTRLALYILLPLIHALYAHPPYFRRCVSSA